MNKITAQPSSHTELIPASKYGMDETYRGNTMLIINLIHALPFTFTSDFLLLLQYILCMAADLGTTSEKILLAKSGKDETSVSLLPFKIELHYKRLHIWSQKTHNLICKINRSFIPNLLFIYLC